jgi:hypothetical protein
VPFSLLLIEAADPAGSWVIFTVPAEDIMNLIDEAQREPLVFFVPRLTMKLQEVADGKSVGP